MGTYFRDDRWTTGLPVFVDGGLTYAEGTTFGWYYTQKLGNYYLFSQDTDAPSYVEDFSIRVMDDGEFHITFLAQNTLSPFNQFYVTLTTETYGGIGWHFYYFAFKRFGSWDQNST